MFVERALSEGEGDGESGEGGVKLPGAQVLTTIGFIEAVEGTLVILLGIGVGESVTKLTKLRIVTGESGPAVELVLVCEGDGEMVEL